MSPDRATRPAVFLDRDGTLIREDGWVTRPDQVRLIDGAVETLRRIRALGRVSILVTNQSAVARGLIAEDDLERIHDRLRALLSDRGAPLDAIYACPHHPEAKIPAYRVDCDCRKPKPGMLLRAARDHAIDLTRSIAVGDDLRDLEAGAEAGARIVLVRTGKGAAREREARRRFGASLCVLDSIADLDPSDVTG